MKIRLWKNFKKRNNSTLQPSGSYTELDVVLKNDTSIEAPEFILKGNEFNYNYLYVPTFKHYYFINDIVSMANGLIRIICKQDILATYKADILNYEGFITYAASAYDPMIPDGRIATKNEIAEIRTTAFTWNDSAFNANGCYVLAVTSQDGGANGFTSLYIMDEATVNKVSKYMNSTLLSDSSLVTKLKNLFTSPIESVISCLWLPLNLNWVVTTLDADYRSIYLADIAIKDTGGNDIKAYLVTTPEILVTGASSALTTFYSDFRKTSPYTKAELYIPFYGMIPVSMAEFPELMSLRLQIDIMTGDATLRISTQKTTSGIASLALVSNINFNLGVKCIITQSSQDYSRLMHNLEGAVAGSSIGAITDLAVQLSSTSKSTLGSVSGRSMTGFNSAILYQTALSTTDPENMRLTMGRPYQQYSQLSAFTGFVQVQDASIYIDGFENDRNAINGMLNSGIFIE